MSLGILVWILLVPHVLAEENNNDKNNIKGLYPQWGVAYKQIGFVYPNVERHYVTIDLELPKRKTYGWNFDLPLNCGISTHSAIMDICQRSAETLRIVKRGSLSKIKLIRTRFDDIERLLPIAKKEREKRFIFSAIALFTGAIGFVSQISMHRKITALQKSVATLEENDFILDKKITTLYQNQITIVQKTAEKFKQIENRINNQNVYIKNITTQLATNIVNLETNFLALFAYSIRLTTCVDQFMYKSSLYFQSAEQILQSYYDGILDLMTGKIPRDLIGPNELTEILGETAEGLQLYLPDYELLHQTLAHYYKKTDLVYDVVGDHLVVTIPIMIKKKNQKLMPLYQVQTCHVPYVVKEEDSENEMSFTRLRLKKEYIAILDSNFVEFSGTQMDNCVAHDEIWTCDSILLQTHYSKMSCLAAIYWEHDGKQIKELCDFEYFHNIKPNPTILESEYSILMANLDIPWSFDCKNRNVPLRIKGSKYAVLSRESICGCSILGSGFYIEEKVCKQSLNKIDLKYPLNGAVLAYHREIMDQNHIENLSGLFVHPPQLTIPRLNLSFNRDENVLVETDVGQPIPLARVSRMLKKPSHIYYDKDEKQITNSKFENWWSGENIAIGCAFILAIIGGIAAIIGICNCVRTHRVSSTMGALMLQQMPKANALPMFCKRDASILEILPPLMVQLTISLTIFLVVKLLWRWYVNWSVVKIIDPAVVSIKTNNTVHLCLEMFNEREYLRVYLFTVKTNPMYITMYGSIVNMTLKLEMKKLYAYFELDWGQSDIAIKQDGRVLVLPCIAYIPIHNYLKAKRLTNNDHGVRLIMTSDGMTYTQSERFVTKLAVDEAN